MSSSSTTNRATGHVSSSRASFRERESCSCENHGFAHANNRALDDDRRAVRALPQSRHRDRRRNVRGDRCRHGRPAAGRSCRRQAADGRRRALPDDPPVSERPAGARRGARFRAVAVRDRRGSASASSTSRRYEQEVEIDWTSGSFMLVRREALLSVGSSTSVLHLRRGAGSLPSDAGAPGGRYATYR